MEDKIIPLDSERILDLERRVALHDESFREIKQKLFDLESGQAGIMSILTQMQVKLDRINGREHGIKRKKCN